MKNVTSVSSFRLIATIAFVAFPVVAMNASAQKAEYKVTNPYPREKGPYEVGSPVGSLLTREKGNTKVERFLEIADAALKATPPKYLEAESALRFAIIADAEDTQAYFWLGNVYFKQRRFKDAAEVYKEVIRLQPTWPDSHYNLGLTYHRLNMKKEAQRELKTLESLHSNLADKLAAALR
ncbi:MAG TPA: tetratricopeptide repeat protein [Pyrinomonadaceae bacterium]|nr:tetratricopeptide repeat protein [Pyrinomonadaceae bacterium]